MIIVRLLCLVLLAMPAYAGGEYFDDYLCRQEMERAMRAHDDLAGFDAELKKAGPYRQSMTIGEGLSYITINRDGYIVHDEPADTRTDDQKLDDEIKSIEARRTRLHEQQIKDSQWNAAKAKNADQHALAKRLWEAAKQHCWGKP